MKRLMALLLMLCIALTGMALAEDELYEEVDFILLNGLGV